MNRTHNRRNPWVEGSLASWMGGVTLGVVLGVTLLIVTPRLMAAPGESAKAPTAAEQSADSAPSGSSSSDAGMAEAGSGAATDSAAGDEGDSQAMAGAQDKTGSEQPAGGTAADPDTSSTRETATTNAPTTETPADNQTSGGELPAAQSPAMATPTTGKPAQQDTNATAESVAASGQGDAAPTPNAAEGNAEAGTEIFASNCAGCHGAQGGGGIGPSLVTNQGPKAWTLAQFTTVLREGVLPEGRELSAVMPRFSDAQLSDTQVADLLAHIKTLN